jgi:dihydrodipicolinate synthase/N-acetylneuraminate lyase
VRYARDIGADAVQICFPGWMEMRVEDYDQFLIDVYQAVPDIALIHYNTKRTKKHFFADDYLRVLPHVPTLIGTKALVPFNDFIELMARVPQINHFCRDDLFSLAHPLGCKGTYSSWFMMNPKFFLDYYQMCVEGRYAEAIEVTKRLTLWLADAVFPLLAKGYMDPTLDKAFVQMAGWLPVKNRLTRKPYHQMADDDLALLREGTQRLMPEFLNYRS